MANENHLGITLFHENEEFDTDLSGKVYVDYTFNKCRFTKAKLYKTEFITCKFVNCTFSQAQLERTIFNRCTFESCVFPGANLFKTDFQGSNFITSSFAYSRGQGSCFDFVSGHHLSFNNAYLTRCSFISAGLAHASFESGVFNQATFEDSYLFGSDFTNAELTDCNFQDSCLSGVIGLNPLVAAALQILPEGTLIVYKKLRHDAIAQLEIPADALRSNATGRKCRASKAKVLAIWDSGDKLIESEYSLFNDFFKYIVGTTVYACSDEYQGGSKSDSDPFPSELQYFLDDRWEECGAGIHFFLTKEEARDYEF